jgi:hypothetical protein
MTRPEISRSSLPEIPPLLTDAVLNTVFYGRYGRYDEEGLIAQIEQARAGQEVIIPLVPEKIWTPGYSDPGSENYELRQSLSGRLAYPFQEWLWENSQQRGGFWTEALRDPTTGRLANPDFIAALTQTGQAVELTKRYDEARGKEVVVNNVWSLYKVIRGGFLPLAAVDSVDADVDATFRWKQYSPRGPAFLHVPYPVLVGRKLVILPGLELPQAPAA